ncbi:SAV_915 family protein [Streptomyces sp. NPDC057638]|uniref:SAV_915 family protein n=1 Tax=Streptomyces sp. NPDC057638 TaxID=3346190 RepID=UPI0036A4EE54
MNTLTREDADPDEPRPVGPWYVPVRPGSTGFQLRFMRTPVGARTAVAFTSRERLTAVLGSRQSWVRLAEPALRTLAEPLGVTTVTVDPGRSAGVPVPRSRRSPVASTARCGRRGGGPGDREAGGWERPPVATAPGHD